MKKIIVFVKNVIIEKSGRLFTIETTELDCFYWLLK